MTDRPILIFTAGTSTGRVCDGYALAVTSSLSSQLSAAFCGSYESRSLQFFVERTVGQLTTFFPDDLWTRQVLQVAQSETGIRHALIALSSYHEAYVNDSSTDEVPFALNYYNRSIKHFRENGSRSSWTYVYLVSCSLFICIEVCRYLKTSLVAYLVDILTI